MGLLYENSRTTPSLDKIYRDMHAEKLHLKYYEYVLGIHSKASNLATVGELGRFPIYNFVKAYLNSICIVKEKNQIPCFSKHCRLVNSYIKMILNLGIVEWILF